MSSFTTEKDRPDEGPSNIGQTRGAWIRKTDKGMYEIYFDGQFIAGWESFNESIAAAMVEHVADYQFRQGEKKAQSDLRKALGLKP